LGLSGETGEVAEKFKKIYRDKGGVINSDDRLEIQKELGDVLWYLAVLSDTLGLTLEEVAALNLEKLKARQQRGQLHGSGDNR
jgi:NTP pyrophosphatase (non-canonical NTP hydrolase)